MIRKKQSTSIISDRVALGTSDANILDNRYRNVVAI